MDVGMHAGIRVVVAPMAGLKAEEKELAREECEVNGRTLTTCHLLIYHLPLEAHRHITLIHPFLPGKPILIVLTAAAAPGANKGLSFLPSLSTLLCSAARHFSVFTQIHRHETQPRTPRSRSKEKQQEEQKQQEGQKKQEIEQMELGLQLTSLFGVANSSAAVQYRAGEIQFLSACLI